VPPQGVICPLTLFIQRRLDCGDLERAPAAPAATAPKKGV
jgi:hypothetical protein